MISGLRAATTYEVRYRSRRTASCDTGSPDIWSSVGKGTTSGIPINDPPTFPATAPATVSVNENAGEDMNVGLPVAAVDPDGARDILTYSLKGQDAESFQVVPETGQIRTRSGRTYDFEDRDTYNVTMEARDMHDETASFPVTIEILDLKQGCSLPPRLRLNPQDRLLIVRWDPLEDEAETAAVLGYEIERRAGSNGAWGNPVVVRGREKDLVYLSGLTNLQTYEVRIRPFGPEGDCDWSAPVSGIPQTDRSPLDREGFQDRLGPGGRLSDRRFLATGRFSEEDRRPACPRQLPLREDRSRPEPDYPRVRRDRPLRLFALPLVLLAYRRFVPGRMQGRRCEYRLRPRGVATARAGESRTAEPDGIREAGPGQAVLTRPSDWRSVSQP